MTRTTLRSRLDGRSPEVLALTALLCGAAACLVLAVLFPMSEQAPVRLGWAMIAVTLLMALGTLTLGDRLPRHVLLGEAALAVVLNSVLVAYAHTTGGAIADAIAYFWLTLYVAVFFPGWAGAFAALVAAGFGLGLLASGLPDMVAAWGLVSVSTAMAGAVLSRVSRLVRRHVATDTLTGALNRGGLDAAIQRSVLRGRGRAEDVAVAALDLDAFKRVNDEQGHAHGDRLLADLSSAWRACLREDDLLARTGGDEFVLVLPGTTTEGAAIVLERLRRAHPAPWSAGIARWRAGESMESCLHRADQRLYAAKAARPRAA
jgi:diguanylate cyclase (GGDEF)-like protein